MQDNGADYVDASYRNGKTDTISISHDKEVIVGFAKECVGWLIGMRMKGTAWKHGRYRIPSCSRISSGFARIFTLPTPVEKADLPKRDAGLEMVFPLFCSLSLAFLVFRYPTNRGVFVRPREVVSEMREDGRRGFLKFTRCL